MSPVTIDDWLDLTQTAALIAMGGAVWWAFALLRREVKNGMATLIELLRSQRDVERRIELAWQQIVKIERRLDAVEEGEPPPPRTRPTDPPL